MIDSDVDCINKPSTDLSDVTLLSELEELKVSFLCSKTFQSLNVFLKQLATCCTKLRVLKLSKLFINSYRTYNLKLQNVIFIH